MLYYSQKLHKFYNTEEAAFNAEHNIEEHPASPKEIRDAIDVLLFDLQAHGDRFYIVKDNPITGDMVGFNIQVMYPNKP